MHHIFVSSTQLSDHGDTLRVTGDDFHHIVRVLRMKAGDELSVSLRDAVETTERAEYRFGIEAIEEDALVCKLHSVKCDTAELPVRLVLLQGLPKADKMEQIIEKNTELGIAEIVPVALKRCVVKLDDKKAVSRVARWNKIAEAAAKQSRRGVIPKVTEIMSLTQALTHVGDADLKLIPYELASESGMALTRSLIERAKPGQTAAIFIGPEGGFADEEVSAAKQKGFTPVTLGGRILRTETAGMTVTAWFAWQFS